MAVTYPLLYVTGGPSEGDGIVALSFRRSAALFRGRGDATLAHYKGRTQISGTAVYENIEAARTAVAAAPAEKVYTCKDAAGAGVDVTFADFAVDRSGGNWDSGLAGGDVPGVSCSFTASAVTLASSA